MGARGPSAKPTALKILEGNPGKRTVNGNEPRFRLSEESKTPPPWLGRYGKKEWKRVFPLLEKNGLVTDADYLALCGYCQCADTWITAEKVKREKGLVTVSATGTHLPHPAVGIASHALQNLLRYAREFGLTPSARTALTAQPAEEENPLLALMKRNEVNGR